MNFAPLTPVQKQSFEEDGFLIVRNALDPQTNQSVLEACDRLAQSFLNKGEILNKPWYNDLDLRPGLLEEKALYDLVAHSKTVALLVQLMSSNIHLHSTALTYKRSENPDYPDYRRGWHRDIRVPWDLGHTKLPLVGIKICYCLTDFDKADSGMTIFARGSHMKEEPLQIQEGKIDPEDHEICDLQLKAGDAVLFENRIFHTATPNRTDRIQKRIIYGYAYRWMKPEIYLDKINKKRFDKSDPVTRQLLGWYEDIDTRPWALEDWAKKYEVYKSRPPWFITKQEP